jgi:hypothetical protein
MTTCCTSSPRDIARQLIFQVLFAHPFQALSSPKFSARRKRFGVGLTKCRFPHPFQAVSSPFATRRKRFYAAGPNASASSNSRPYPAPNFLPAESDSALLDQMPLTALISGRIQPAESSSILLDQMPPTAAIAGPIQPPVSSPINAARGAVPSYGSLQYFLALN